MGYDGSMLMASIFFLGPIFVIGGVFYALALKPRILPPGIAALPAFWLIMMGGYAACFLVMSVYQLLILPSRLQEKYLGQSYAAPFAIRSYEHYGFMDPEDIWIYTLKPDVVDDLRRRCLTQFADRTRCYLFAAEDHRWSASVWIEGGNLYIRDGLH